MEYSRSRNQLFTGGRDGIIKIWDSDSGKLNGYDIDGNESNLNDGDVTGDINERILKLETSISSNPLTFNKIKHNFNVTNKNFDLHFDWINDLKLVNNDNDLVSCSSDLSLKITNLNENTTSKFENIHTDYVKKLSHFKDQDLILSGGLDGKIVLWDLNQLKSINVIKNYNNINTSDSIYSLANNNYNLISAGGPNNIINLFDKRLENPYIKKLIGHQNNVRCLLMNDNFILSGSSDCTIKLWDLRNSKILKNFTIHDDPVWCLHSASDDFSTFYSADKSGMILKTDLSHLPGDLLDNNTISTENFGLSTFVAKSSSSILALTIENDSIFASTDMSLDRYQIPNTDNLANYQYYKSLNDIPIEVVEKDEDLKSDIYDLVSHMSVDSNHELQSNFSHNTADNGDDNEYESMFLDVNGGCSRDFVNIDKGTPQDDDYVDLTPVEILLNPVSSEQVNLIPFNKKPLKSYGLTPKSVIAKRLFNNKRTMLVLYLNGDIAIWDLLICKKIKSFPYNTEKLDSLVTNEMIKKRIKDMDDIFQTYQTTDTLNNWCEVEIKSGKLLVTITETNFNNIEIYYDELIASYPFLQYEKDEEAVKNTKIRVSGDDRLQVSRIFLNSIFRNYSLFEWNFDNQLREELRSQQQKKVPDGAFKKMFSRKSSSNGIPTLKRVGSRSSGINSTNISVSSQNNSAVNSANISINEIESPVHEFINSTEEVDDDSISYILNDNKYKYQEKLTISSKLPDSNLKLYTNNYDHVKNYYSSEEFLPYKPVIPFNELPSNLLIIIFENSSDLGNLRDLFSFRLSDLSDASKLEENYQLIKNLRSFLPKWIGQPILLDKFPIKEFPKIAFQLLELDYTTLPPEKKIHGKSQRKIKRLPVLESSIKLTSHNMLRVGKILTYLTEKFESRTSEMKDKIPATEWLVLECKGQELENNMTLQTIKTKIWKSSSDIELKFRRKYDK